MRTDSLSVIAQITKLLGTGERAYDKRHDYLPSPRGTPGVQLRVRRSRRLVRRVPETAIDITVVQAAEAKRERRRARNLRLWRVV